MRRFFTPPLLANLIRGYTSTALAEGRQV